jgi:hypothetical protein
MVNYLTIVVFLSLGAVIGVASLILVINLIWFLENGEDN